MNSQYALLVPTSPAELIAAAFLSRYPQVTRGIYQIHIRQWFEWCHEHNLDPLLAQRAHIETWARHLTENLCRKPQTVASKLNAVHGLYKYALIDGYIDKDPSAYIRRPRVEFTSSTNGLTRPEFADVLRAAEKESPTSHALICLLGLSGLRIGETLATDIKHLSRDRGYRTIYLPHRKGGRVATLSLAVRTSWAVDQAVGDRDDGPILLGRNGERLNMQAARRTVKRLVKHCGITKRITPHSLRHTFTTMALDAGVPERDIMDSTGHQSSTMIRYYDRNRGAIERNATHAVAAFVGAA